ncbi:response regulator [Flavobacterium humi]|uniref:Response regulator n=1 Tax=Flavobacterium humi TaxID=2562683 RepID=A0A4Z0L521_9FLAO|nr:response regulator [Flavobacterium humi]TGD56662.1 response regulator [Flavobacterium humi]
MQTNTIYILLADDDEDDRTFFRDAFAEIKINANVNVVHDGEELMSYLKRTDIILPHILFLDLNMPRKNGLECLAEIKQLEHLNDMAVAIYSTSASEKDIEESFVRGANIYIKKPNDFDSLIKTLNIATTINWQYHTDSLNKDTFLLRIE